MSFRKDQKVKWTSQAAASSKEKTGIIHFVVPKGKDPFIYRQQFNPGLIHKEMTDYSGLPRDHESYIILVESKSGKGKKMIYWPRVSQLEPILESKTRPDLSFITSKRFKTYEEYVKWYMNLTQEEKIIVVGYVMRLPSFIALAEGQFDSMIGTPAQESLIFKVVNDTLNL